MNYFISSVIRQSFSFQLYPTNLDPSYKPDLDFWDILAGKTHLTSEFHELVFDILVKENPVL